jgi:hypothetical protein
MADNVSRNDPSIDKGHELAEFAQKNTHASRMEPERRRVVEKSLKRKLDARCSLFVLIYIMNYLDRNNIAAARLGGLEDDLNINYNQYATCLSICTFPVSPTFPHRS